MRRHRLRIALLFCLAVATTVVRPASAAAIEPQIGEADQQRIDAAIPRQAMVKPQNPRKLLIFGLNVGYPGHGSIHHANYALAQMGRQTGAFDSVVSNDPEMFRPASLRQFDAVFFNNNVGNLFETPELRQSLVDFIYSGGGMLGVHGTTVAFTRWPGAIEDWPEFGRMIGGRGANHKDSDEPVVIKLDDPTHPLNAPFGGRGFDYRDEFFRVHEPYSRNRLRVLLSIDTEKTDLTQGGPPRGKLERADNDYAVAWIRNYGRGRVFYCTIAHNPYVFWDKTMLQFYLGAVQFALGDLPAPTTPSAQLSPAVLAREQLGWCLELCAGSGESATLFDTIELAQQNRLSYVGAKATQVVSGEITKPFNHQLSDDELRRIRLQLDDAGVRLLTYSLGELPEDEAEAQAIFQFARRMGVEIVRLDQLPDSLGTLASLVKATGVRVCSSSTPASHGADDLLTAEQRTYIGHDTDLTEWVIDDFTGIDLVSRGPNHIFTCRMPSQPVVESSGSTLSPEETLRRLTAFMKLLAYPQLKPIVVRIEYAKIAPGIEKDITASADLLNQVSRELCQASERVESAR